MIWQWALAFHMLNIYHFNDKFKTIVRTGLMAIVRIIWMYIIGLIACIFFAIFLMTAFQQQQFNSTYSPIDCTSGLMCWAYTWFYSEGLSGGMQMVFTELVYGEDLWNWNIFWRNIFGTVNWVVMKLCLRHFVGAIIFASFLVVDGSITLRIKDVENVCFICGLTPNDFVNSKNTFKNHCHDEHSPWKYIYYLFYLNTIDEHDFRTVDHEIYGKFKLHNIDWIPQGKTIFLSKFFFVIKNSG